MSKYLQVFVSAIYVLLIIFSFLVLLVLCGLHFSDAAVVLIMAGWVLFCYYSVYFRTPIEVFFFRSLRRPFVEEQMKLGYCFREVSEKAGCTKKIRLWIDEKEGISACAMGHNIIVISKDALGYFTEEELKGVLAHELGHLLSKDCIFLTAMRTASDLPCIVSYLFSKARKILLAGLAFCHIVSVRINALMGLGFLALIGYFLYKWHLIVPIVGVAAFIFLSNFQWKIFRFFTLLASRFTEYKQDAFAHRLGYGTQLSEALKKLSKEGPQRVNRWQIILNGTHPIIHNRIRKLEELTGMRA
jgi:Zn-dependent protease with chaperone function